MYSEDYLLPPSAFTASLRTNSKPNNENKYYNLGFDQFKFPNSNHINNFSQTAIVKTFSKGTLTTEAIVTHDEMRGKIRSKKSKFMERIHSIQQQHNISTLEMKEIVNNLNIKLHGIEQEKSSVEEELKKMKFYISGVENLDSWLQEKQRLMNEIEQLNIFGHEQQSIIQALKTQLSNIEKIQSIQERELEKDIVKSVSTMQLPQEIRFESLLRAWRQKVLSLLVQQESNDVLWKKERHQLNLESQRKQNEIDHLQSSVETLRLKLESNDAQLLSKDTIMEKLRRDISNCQNQIEINNEEKVINQRNLNIVFTRLQSFQKEIERDFESKLQKASSKIDCLQRRLSYANSRFPMIQAGTLRLRNISERNENVNQPDSEYPEESMISRISDLEDALLITNKERLQLQAERDHLIRSVEKDSATFQERLNEKKNALDEEMKCLRENVQHLDMSLSKTQRELDIIKNENKRIKISYDDLLKEKYNETEILQAALNESKTDLSTLSLEFSELKRASINEKNKLEEKILSNEKTFTEREQMWARNLDSLNAECNMLKMTIRQNGILKKLKSRSATNDPYGTSRLQVENSGLDSVMKQVEDLANELQATVIDNCH